MPVIDKGTHQCKKCGQEFEWVYFEFVRNHMSQSIYQVEMIPDSHLLVRKYTGTNGNAVYRKNCPHCDYENKICRIEQSEASDK